MAWRSLLSVLSRTSASSTVPHLSAPALFGKLPDRPDFVRLGGSPQPELEPWLEKGLETVNGKGGALPSTPLRFLNAATPPGRSVVGVLAPSMDAVGRSFPVCLFRSFNDDGGGANLGRRWRAHADFLLAAEELLSRVPVPSTESLAASLSGWQDGAPADGRRSSPAEAETEDHEHPQTALARELDGVAERAAQALAEMAELAQPAPAVGSAPIAAAAPFELPDLRPPAAESLPALQSQAGGSIEDLVTAVLRGRSSRAALEPLFGPVETGEAAHALVTFVSACEAARSAATSAGGTGRSLTLEVPGGDEAMELFWLALAGRRLRWMSAGPSLASQGSRLVLELVDGAATPALLVAASLGEKAGPRHWTIGAGSNQRPASPSELPTAARRALHERGATLFDLLENLA